MFLLSSHPLILGFLLIVFSVILGFFLYITIITPWITYILIIVFLRGIIIIFMYISSLTSNESSFYFNFRFFTLIFYRFFLRGIIYLFINHKSSYLINLNNPVYDFQDITLKFIYKRYSFLFKELTLIIIIYLLVVLIAAVKITGRIKAPLRRK